MKKNSCYRLKLKYIKKKLLDRFQILSLLTVKVQENFKIQKTKTKMKSLYKKKMNRKNIVLLLNFLKKIQKMERDKKKYI